MKDLVREHILNNLDKFKLESHWSVGGHKSVNGKLNNLYLSVSWRILKSDIAYNRVDVSEYFGHFEIKRIIDKLVGAYEDAVRKNRLERS